MPNPKRITKVAAIARLDFTPLLPASIPSDATIKAQLGAARRQSAQLRKVLQSLEEKTRDLEAKDRLGNFEIQDLMSQFNQAETLASSVIRKRDDTANAVIAKLS